MITQLAQENRTWGVPRIHGELVKLGYNISQSTVYRYIHHTKREKPSQHINVTKHPTSFWTAQQIRNALYGDNIYKYVIRDRDCKFGKYFRKKISDVGIKEIITAYRSPWQNGYVDRLIGSI